MTTLKVNKPSYSSVEYVKKLRHAQFSQEQSETIAQETEQIMESMLQQTWQVLEAKDLVTQSAARETELKLLNEIGHVRRETENIRK